PLDVVGAALADFDDVDRGKTHRASDLRRTLAVAFSQISFRPLLQSTDRGDHDAHVSPTIAARPSADVSTLWARPHLLELIEGAHFRSEYMHDDIAGVDQDPVAMRHAFDAHVADAGLVQVFDQAISDRAHLPIGPSGGHNQEVGERAFAGEIDGDDVLSL